MARNSNPLRNHDLETYSINNFPLKTLLNLIKQNYLCILLTCLLWLTDEVAAAIKWKIEFWKVLPPKVKIKKSTSSVYSSFYGILFEFLRYMLTLRSCVPDKNSIQFSDFSVLIIKTIFLLIFRIAFSTNATCLPLVLVIKCMPFSAKKSRLWKTKNTFLFTKMLLSFP